MRCLPVLLLLIVIVAQDGCATAGHSNRTSQPAAGAGRSVTLYVIKRKWHIDIGFNAADLNPPLASVRSALPNARYLLFGFGDRHYLLTRGSFGRYFGSIWPGPGLVLMTGLEVSPETAFGATEVIRIEVSATQALALEEFVWKTLDSSGPMPAAGNSPMDVNDRTVSVLAPGPYDGSVYYASVKRYSLLHTCNTWAAEGLLTAGVPVHSTGVQFSGQLWRQLRRIERDKAGPSPDRPSAN